MTLLLQLFLGSIMIGTTVIFHAAFLDLILKNAKYLEGIFKSGLKPVWKPLTAGTVVVGVFISHVVHIWMWAVLFLLLHCAPLQGFSEALYFATVSYTTLGFGDIILEPSCRMLSGVEAANGFILFGWTTAFIFEVISQLYRKEVKSL